jgi:predicted DNA-binding protein YlxM (UPF0122 family)
MAGSVLLRAAEYGELYAYYGALLQRETREVLELHLDEDYSLAEIAARYGLSRQAIAARIKKGIGELKKADNALSLRAADRRLKAAVGAALSALDLGDVEKAKRVLSDLLARQDAADCRD